MGRSVTSTLRGTSPAYRYSFYGQDPNFGLLQPLYSCTAGLLPILSTDSEAARNSGLGDPNTTVNLPMMKVWKNKIGSAETFERSPRKFLDAESRGIHESGLRIDRKLR